MDIIAQALGAVALALLGGVLWHNRVAGRRRGRTVVNALEGLDRALMAHDTDIKHRWKEFTTEWREWARSVDSRLASQGEDD